ncbi:MAG: hypothetical protein HQK54_16160, partial [Oligoflexales bacterium]|nr:hypothetical protein [Oligoflexales bacterium]
MKSVCQTFTLLFILFMPYWQQTFAQEPEESTEAGECACEQYRGIAEVYSNSIRAALVSSQASIVDMTDRRLIFNAMRAIPVACHNMLLPMNLIRQRGRTYTRDGRTPFVSSSDEADRLRRTYTSFIRLFEPYTQTTDCTLAGDRQACILENNRKIFQTFQRTMQGHLPSDVYLYFRLFLSESEIRTIRLYNEILVGGDILSFARANRENYSPEEVWSAILMLGHQASIDYNYDRIIPDHPDRQGIVTLNEIRSTARYNMEIGAYSSDRGRFPGNRARHGGVCRDIASAQGEILQAFGFRNTFAVAHETRRSRHMTLISQHPTENRIYRLDYGRDITVSRSDTRALFAGINDRSTNYRVYLPAGAQKQTI